MAQNAPPAQLWDVNARDNGIFAGTIYALTRQEACRIMAERMGYPTDRYIAEHHSPEGCQNGQYEAHATVIFRRWLKRPYTVIALFPYIPGTSSTCLSYEHVGQHGSADYSGIIRATEPVAVLDAECSDLKAELEGMGYVLYPTKRATALHC